MNADKLRKLSNAISKEIYSARLLVLLECDDHFHQLMFTKEQFLRVSNACSGPFVIAKKGPEETLKINIREDTYDPKQFENALSHYDEEDFN